MSSEADPQECPYVGLEPFAESHASFFFGRRQESKILADTVIGRSVTVLYGPSGTGKTSLLNVGLWKEMPKSWIIAQMRDWQNPDTIERLAVEAVLKALKQPRTTNRHQPGFAALIARAVRRAKRPLLLILDQFEEYFLYRNRERMRPVEQAISALVSRRDLRVHLLIAIREDALHQLTEFRSLIPSIMDTMVRLDHLRDRAVAEATSEPIRVYNDRYRAGHSPIIVHDTLIATLLRQLKEAETGLGKGRSVNSGEKQIELPYLQLALTKLWAAEGGRNAEALRAETLTDRLGGVARIVRSHVWETLSGLEQAEQTLCVRIFDRLVTGIGSKVAYPTEALITDDAGGQYATQESIEALLGKLAQREARIVKPVTTDGRPGYELLHDVLGPPVLEWLRAQRASGRALDRLSPAGRISKTYRLEVPAIQTYPEYRIPPESDRRFTVRFGCAPLLDCCFPLIVQTLDPDTWNSLARSHAIDVLARIANFSDLFDAVHSATSDSGVDIVVASAASVDRARSPSPYAASRKILNRAPVAVLPILQQFNAYYIFGRRTELVAYLRRKGLSRAAAQCAATPATSTLNAELKGHGDRTREIIRDILQEFIVCVERGADLDAALASYWTRLEGDYTQAPFRFAETDSIESSFGFFLSSEKPSLFMGGLAQTAFLMRRSGVGDEYITIAGPSDVAYHNVNSLVCSRELANDRPTAVFRFIGWWFDVLNCFRRSFLFAKTRDPERYKAAVSSILRGLKTIDDGTIPLVPPGSTIDDIERLLDFLRIRSAHESGNFMLPNIHDALKVKTALTEDLRRLDAVVDLIPSESELGNGKGPWSSQLAIG